MKRALLSAAAALSLSSTVSATSNNCFSDLCYSLSIPETTANSGSGDIYFQISAPTSYSWAALGQGSGMVGANMFVMYQSADGKNVTVSPRYATGYEEPQHDTTAHITLLEGSGVSGGKMTANVRCSNCQSWSGGTMDFSDSTADFVYAGLSGSAIQSDSLTATITEHSVKDAFSWDISDAKGGSESVNPFVASSSSGGSTAGSTAGSSGSGSSAASSSIPSTCTPMADSAGSSTAGSSKGSGGSAASSTLAGPSGSGCPTTWPAYFSTAWPTASPPAWVEACYPHGRPTKRGEHFARVTDPPLVAVENFKRDDGCPAGYQSTSSSVGSITNDGSGLSPAQQATMVLAHGVLACLAFVALFPIGGILIRVANFTGLIWVHAGLQMVGYLVYIVAFAMGVYLATSLDYMTKTHPIIGIALFVVLFFQPILGVLHHKLFKKYGHRTFWSYLHLFHGRAAIIVGMVNGGLGIRLAGTTSRSATIAYAVIAALVAVVYIAVVIFGEIRRKRSGPPTYEKSQKAHQLRDLSSSESNLPPTGVDAPPPPPPPHQEYYGREDSRF